MRVADMNSKSPQYVLKDQAFVAPTELFIIQAQ